MEKFLTQINGTDNGKWTPIEAPDLAAAALGALRRVENTADLLPCTVYVSLGSMRHEDGAPMAVQSFKVERKVEE